MHGILEDDAGVVWGDTWHQMPQYTQLDQPPTLPMVRCAIGAPVEKQQLYFRSEREDGSSRRRKVEAYCLWRPDTGRVLVPAVGSRYTVIQRRTMVDWIEENLLSKFPDLVLESAGTLWGGRVAFVNMVLERFHVKGDGSESLNRLMYYDPLGEGPYRVCAHTVRVVCNNTLRLAAEQSVHRDAMLKVKHTSGAEAVIGGHLVDLAETRLALTTRKEELQALAMTRTPKVNARFVNSFLSAMFPAPVADRKLTKAEQAGLERREANVTTQRNGVRTVFETDPQGLDKVATTPYGLLNAFTYWIDHARPVRAASTDAGTRFWDGLTGGTSAMKVAAHEWLVEAVLKAA